MLIAGDGTRPDGTVRPDARLLITVVVAARDEEAALPPTLPCIRTELDVTGCPWEVLLVDDGSRDRTVSIWRGLMAGDPRLGLVRFTRPFGKEAALMAGLARGGVVIPMDADLQDPPALIHRFLERWRQGWDMPYGLRCDRAESRTKRWCAWLYYRGLNALSSLKIPLDAGDFRLLDRAVVDDLLRLPEAERYTKGLYAWVGRASYPVPYDRPARVAGPVRMTWGRLAELALEGVVGFVPAPLRLLCWVGLTLILAAVGLLGWSLLHRGAVPSLEILLLFLGGMQLVALGLVALGLVAEYLARILREVRRRLPYLVPEKVLHGPCPASLTG
jgi:glycosyltransferase involved in cell wall biosynthesis